MEKKSKLLPISIIIASVVMAAGLIINAVPTRYKVVGNRVFDTLKGMYVDQNNIDLLQTNNKSIPEERTTEAIKTSEQPKGDFSKVSILRHSSEVDNIFYTIKCTIQNKDTINHLVYVKATYYDKNKTAILTVDSERLNIKSGDIKNLNIICTENLNEIESYDLELLRSKYESFTDSLENME